MEELAVLWVVVCLFQLFENGDYISELGIMHDQVGVDSNLALLSWLNNKTRMPVS